MTIEGMKNRLDLKKVSELNITDFKISSGRNEFFASFKKFNIMGSNSPFQNSNYRLNIAIR